MSEEAAGQGVIEPAGGAPIPPVEPPKTVRLQVSAVAKLNLAYFQNAVPALQELAIHNETPVAFSELTLTVTAEPAILKARTWTLDAVGAGETYHLSDLDVQLDGALLSQPSRPIGALDRVCPNVRYMTPRSHATCRHICQTGLNETGPRAFKTPPAARLSLHHRTAVQQRRRP